MSNFLDTSTTNCSLFTVPHASHNFRNFCHFSLSIIFSKMAVVGYLLFFLCTEAILYFIHACPLPNRLKFCNLFWHGCHNSSLFMKYNEGFVVCPFPITIIICLFDYLWKLILSKAKLTGSFAIKFRGSEFNLLFCLLSI